MSRKLITSDGTIHYYHYNKLHREDGPAKISTYMKEWYINGELHRDCGPTVIYNHPKDGYAYMWHCRGKAHREYNPAIIMRDKKFYDIIEKGYEEKSYMISSTTNEIFIWYVDGINITDEVKKYMESGKLGYNYTIWTEKEKSFFKLRFL